MSRFAFTPILPGDDRAAAPVNNLWSDAETASGAVDAENFAEEGLDGTALEATPVGLRSSLVDETVRPGASLAAAAAFTQFNQNGTAMRLVLPVALGADEALRIRFRTFLATSLAAGLGVQGSFAVRLAWNNGTVTAKVPFTEARLTKIPALTAWYHGNVVTEGWLFGSIATIAWIEAQYTLSVGGVAFPGKSWITARRFRRVKVV